MYVIQIRFYFRQFDYFWQEVLEVPYRKEYGDIAEKAVQCLDEGFESAMIVMTLPKSLRRYFRTSRHPERVNKELKRRSNVIGVFPNEASLLRLMGNVLLELDERYSAYSKIHFAKEEAAMLDSLAGQLKEAAQEQHRLMAA